VAARYGNWGSLTGLYGCLWQVHPNQVPRGGAQRRLSGGYADQQQERQGQGLGVSQGMVSASRSSMLAWLLSSGPAQPCNPDNGCCFQQTRLQLDFADCACGAAQGGWEDDETVEAAALRETVEEAGVRGNIEVQHPEHLRDVHASRQLLAEPASSSNQ